jgi:hypothetical protein
LRLPTFQNYRKLAEDAGRADLTYELPAQLAEQEIAQREQSAGARIRAARFRCSKSWPTLTSQRCPTKKA